MECAVPNMPALLRACCASAQALWLQGPLLPAVPKPTHAAPPKAALVGPPPAQGATAPAREEADEAAQAPARAIAASALLQHLRLEADTPVPPAEAAAQRVLVAVGGRLLTLDLLLPALPALPPALWGCSALQHLTLRFGAQMPKQKELSSGRGPTAIAQLSTLTGLRSLALLGPTWLSACYLEHPSQLVPLSALTALTHLHVDRPGTLSDSAYRGHPIDLSLPLLPMLRGLSSLVQLVLPGSWVTAHSLQHLTALTLLSAEGLRATSATGEEGAGGGEPGAAGAAGGGGGGGAGPMQPADAAAPEVPLPQQLARLELAYVPSVPVLAALWRHPRRPRLALVRTQKCHWVVLQGAAPVLALAESPHVTWEAGGEALCLPAWVVEQVGDAARLLARDVLRRERAVRLYGSKVKKRKAREEVPTVGCHFLGADGRVAWEGCEGGGGGGGGRGGQLGARRGGKSSLVVRSTDEAYYMGWRAVLRGPHAGWMGQLGALAGHVDELVLQGLELAAADLRALWGTVPNIKVGQDIKCLRPAREGAVRLLDWAAVNELNHEWPVLQQLLSDHWWGAEMAAAAGAGGMDLEPSESDELEDYENYLQYFNDVDVDGLDDMYGDLDSADPGGINLDRLDDLYGLWPDDGGRQVRSRSSDYSD